MTLFLPIVINLLNVNVLNRFRILTSLLRTYPSPYTKRVGSSGEDGSRRFDGQICYDFIGIETL